MFTLTVVIVVGVACLVIGAIGGPTILKTLADIKGDIRKDYEATIADLTAAKNKAEAAVAPAVQAVEAKYQAMVADLTAAKTTAENDVAALKRFITPAAQTSPVPDVAVPVAPAPVLTGAAPATTT